MKRWRPAFILAVLVLALATAALFVRRPADPALFPARSGDAVIVYVLDNGFHSNIALPREALEARGGPLAAALAQTPDSPWVAIGWGDRRFFTERGVSLRRAGDGLRALFAPNNAAAVMIEPLRAAPDRLYRDGVLPLRLSPAGFGALADRVDRSFVLRDGAPAPGPRGPVPEARFFDSVETFSVLRLCNHWTSDVLHAAGVPTRPLLDWWGAGLTWDIRTGAAEMEPAS